MFDFEEELFIDEMLDDTPFASPMEFDQEKYNSELCSMYLHACDLLQENNWNITSEYKQDTTIWYDYGYCVFVEEVYEDMGTTMRFEFDEVAPNHVVVYSRHKCNQPGCFYTEPEYEGEFDI